MQKWIQYRKNVSITFQQGIYAHDFYNSLICVEKNISLWKLFLLLYFIYRFR